jgi:5-methylcytosine-specific restriction endonuclease McrA
MLRAGFAIEPLQVRRRLAALSWRVRVSTENPNAFRVHFVPDINAYNEYLKSPIWKEIRQRVLTAANFECAGCFDHATEVHHRDYRPRVLAGEDITPLVALCTECHRTVDGDGSKARDTWNEREAILAALVRKKEAALSRRTDSNTQ